MTTTHDLDLPALARWGNERVPTALFWVVSGSHVYGFPSADSDIDLRGCFLAPLRAIVGLRPPTDTVEPRGGLVGREVEAVSHEVGKYLRLMCMNEAISYIPCTPSRSTGNDRKTPCNCAQ
ncbi:putative nucleotidyltransferase [Gemmata sp. SH-PL17]|uniref:DNA polymerase beta superfamily protein n=1 Tax=Gemmata sp. SH-PL17 TaxID=1630693 RepID=UPI00078D7846|nr:nucleotidyltransferase domain-containing protein [Gemmata sp. SH-PL17]AMV25419.1 putative nucleotidyltransferase [Gemmata sp. SH-PL17]